MTVKGLSTPTSDRFTGSIHDTFGDIGSTIADGASTVGRGVAIGAKFVKKHIYDRPADWLVHYETVDADERVPSGAIPKLGEWIVTQDTIFNNELVQFEEGDGFSAKVGKVWTAIKGEKKGNGKLAALQAGLKGYDQVVASYGDKASIKLAQLAYGLTQAGLEFLTGSMICRSRIGRVVQEGLANAVGGFARLIAKVAEYALRALPWIVYGTGFLAYYSAKYLLLSMPFVGVILHHKVTNLESRMAALEKMQQSTPSVATQVEAAPDAAQEAAPAPVAAPAEEKKSSKQDVDEEYRDYQFAAQRAEAGSPAPAEIKESKTPAPKSGLLGWGWTVGGCGI